MPRGSLFAVGAPPLDSRRRMCVPYRLSMLSKFDMPDEFDESGASMTTTTDPTRLSRSDRLAMYVTMLLGAIGIGVTAWHAVARLVEVLPGTDVPVLVPFRDETAGLPIGPGGTSVEVSVDQAVVTVPQPAAATQFALVAEPVVIALAIIAGIA